MTAHVREHSAYLHAEAAYLHWFALDATIPVPGPTAKLAEVGTIAEVQAFATAHDVPFDYDPDTRRASAAKRFGPIAHIVYATVTNPPPPSIRREEAAS